jgi:hypothetical protein
MCADVAFVQVYGQGRWYRVQHSSAWPPLRWLHVSLTQLCTVGPFHTLATLTARSRRTPLARRLLMLVARTPFRSAPHTQATRSCDFSTLLAHKLQPMMMDAILDLLSRTLCPLLQRGCPFTRFVRAATVSPFLARPAPWQCMLWCAQVAHHVAANQSWLTRMPCQVTVLPWCYRAHCLSHCWREFGCSPHVTLMFGVCLVMQVQQHAQARSPSTQTIQAVRFCLRLLLPVDPPSRQPRHPQ